MQCFGLVLLLAACALSAPQGGLKEAKEAQPKRARQLYTQDQPILLQSAPQFGARLSQNLPAGAQLVYLQGNYQQPQYYPAGQQVAYISGAPTKSFVSAAPSQTFYSGQYVQPQANLVAVKKTVKPAVYNVAAGVPQVAYRPPAVSTINAQPSPVVYSGFKAAGPAPAPADKFQAAPAPAVQFQAAPAPAVKFQAAPAPAVKLAANPAAAVSQYSQYTQYSAEPNHVIIKQAQDDNFDGSFSYSYETDHGIAVESSGFLKNAGTEDEVQVIQGSYTYYSPEGVPIITTYIADENGFQVQGDHLPVAPPLPEAIAKSIEYQRSLPPSPEDDLPSRQ